MFIRGALVSKNCLATAAADKLRLKHCEHEMFVLLAFVVFIRVA